MGVDEKTLTALKQALTALKDVPQRPVPADAIASLATIARPGLTLHLDLDASRFLGAPLVSVSDTHDNAALLSSLSARQRQVAGLIIEGLPNKTIATRLEISVATVKDHVHAILTQLNLPSRAALIAQVRR